MPHELRHSGSNMRGALEKSVRSHVQEGSEWSMKQSAAPSGAATANYQAPNLKATLKQGMNQERQNSGHNQRRSNPNKCIDDSYEQWNRFENFLQFASKKEVRDRLKEFDAPNVANYIDPDTVDKINATHKQPPHLRPKNLKSDQPKNDGKASKQILEENKQRIQKMKELYGIFVKMETELENAKKEEQKALEENVETEEARMNETTYLQ